MKFGRVFFVCAIFLYLVLDLGEGEGERYIYRERVDTLLLIFCCLLLLGCSSNLRTSTGPALDALISVLAAVAGVKSRSWSRASSKSLETFLGLLLRDEWVRRPETKILRVTSVT
jgi:hypothetical protein